MLLKIFQLLFVLVAVVVTNPASAGTINVIGFVNFDGNSGAVTLAGDRGFAFVGGAPSGGGFLGPAGCSGNLVSCAPGTPINLSASWCCNDLPGTATLDGTFYPNVGSLGPPTPGHPSANAGFGFAGQVSAPSFGGPSTLAVVTAPVSFTGFFNHDDGQGSAGDEQLLASARATLVLRQIEFAEGSTWLYQRVDYALEPVPEPGSLLLFGTAFSGLGLARLRQWRRKQNFCSRAARRGARLWGKPRLGTICCWVLSSLCGMVAVSPSESASVLSDSPTKC
jgi:hypothetical protein